MPADEKNYFHKLEEEESPKSTDSEFLYTSKKSIKSNLKGDRGNFILLFFLYTLQGLPVQISMSIPLILQMRGALYSEQAIFTFVTYPFVLKLLWAPIVDSVFISKFGRRKSWLIPTQYLMGILMLLISFNFDEWIGSEDRTRPPNLKMLIIAGFLCCLMSATQDVAVDGWSLTMLRRENVGHSGTCNSLGYAVATIFGNTLFICLDSADFCNRWLRVTPQRTGIVPFSNYLFFWAVIFFVTTTFILFFKKDNSLSVVEDESEINLNIRESYSLFGKIMRIKSVQLICLAIVTCRAGFGAHSGVMPLKLIDAGISKDSIATIKVPLVILQVLFPIAVLPFLVGNQSLSGFIGVVPFRIIMDIIISLFIYFVPWFKVNDQISTWYWTLLMILYLLEEMTQFAMSLMGQAYFSKISDPRFGGTYLTLLNTVNNLGSRWPSSLALTFVEPLTWRKCPQKDCEILVDGFYIETAASMVIGIIWYFWAKRKVLPLQKLSDSSWAIHQPRKTKIVGNGISSITAA